MKSIIVKDTLYCLDNLWWAEIEKKYEDSAHIHLHYIDGHGLTIYWLKPDKAINILKEIQKILAE